MTRNFDSISKFKCWTFSSSTKVPNTLLYLTVISTTYITKTPCANFLNDIKTLIAEYCLLRSYSNYHVYFIDNLVVKFSAVKIVKYSRDGTNHPCTVLSNQAIKRACHVKCSIFVPHCLIRQLARINCKYVKVMFATCRHFPSLVIAPIARRPCSQMNSSSVWGLYLSPFEKGSIHMPVSWLSLPANSTLNTRLNVFIV